MKIRIGHPAYTGTNAMKWHESYAAALADLLHRGIKMKEAQRVLSVAKKNVGAIATADIEFRGTRMFGCEAMFWN